MTAETPGAYDDLRQRYGRIASLNGAQQLLSWDQQVMMPSGGQPARSQQVSTLSGLAHELLIEEETGRLLDELDGEVEGERAAVVREIRREYERNVRVPNELVAEISAKTSDAVPVWEEAKEEDDFEAFAPVLEELVELKREYAEHVDPDRDPYAVLFEEFEPYLGLDAAERVLGRLREELVPLIDEIQARGEELSSPFEGRYGEDAQMAVSEAALDALGFDWERGRLDTAAHPFTSGNQFDSRVTTRFRPADPLDALTATVHEFGHAAYQLGLPEEQYGSPLGEDRDLVVHESQSRFWENHVGRTRAFWEQFYPTFADHLGLDASPGAVYRAANRIYPENCIRVEADELTYHMHVVLRFEIERDLIAGDLDVAEVPAVWNDKMEEYLGVRPETDREGCLQDIHWSHGTFGYFPTYSMGSVLAAQIDAALRAEHDVDALVRDGEFGPINDWLTERVHRHGCRYTTDELVEEATGEPYTADYFLDYATEKFTGLYGL
jgi:carboxypeptidase Taq